MRALSSLQCSPGSILVSVICLSLLLVLLCSEGIRVRSRECPELMLCAEYFLLERPTAAQVIKYDFFVSLKSAIGSAARALSSGQDWADTAAK